MLLTPRTPCLPNLLGVFGGTFNPIHNGHVEPIREAAKMLGISEVITLPCANPPHRPAPKITSEHRISMVKIAVADDPLFIVDDRELKRDALSYTVDTLASLKQDYPEHTLCFFIGTDSLLDFQNWYQWRTILQYAHLVVSRRVNDQSIQDLSADMVARYTTNKRDLVTKNAGMIYLAATDLVTISSTKIREIISNDRATADISHYLHLDVFEYIKEHHLYLNDNT